VPTYYTPLRYPGGKRRLTPFVSRLLEANRLRDVQYVEPYAGGASLALALLFEEYAATIHINDLSRAVYAFWHSVLYRPDLLCRRIEQTPVTVAEWHRQRAVYDQREAADLDELGFATFFLNRTNRSGIIGGGVIGGKDQGGTWGIDARYSKAELVQRIRRITRYRNRIRLYHQDALDFTKDVVSEMRGAVLAFYDPPYIEKGERLYLNTYTVDDHRRIEQQVTQLEVPWIVTYDYDAAVRLNLYPAYARLAFQLAYSANARGVATEAMFLSRCLQLPEGEREGIPMGARTSRRPFAARIDRLAPVETPPTPPLSAPRR
jgi:DNA adenine methylase